MISLNCALFLSRTIRLCARASPTCPMPICKVPPSRTRRAACRPMAYLASEIGSAGGANSGKSVAGLSSTAENSSAGQIARPRHERQFGIDLRHQLERGAALRARLQHVERGVGVAGQRIARHAVDDALGHELRHDVEALRQQIGRRVGVVGGNIVLLRDGHVHPAPGEEEELDDADVRRQACHAAAARHRRDQGSRRTGGRSPA